MTNSYFRAPVEPWLGLGIWHVSFESRKRLNLRCIESMSFHPSVILNAFKNVYLILTPGVFVNLDCNLQTVEATPATVIDVGNSAKQTTR